MKYFKQIEKYRKSVVITYSLIFKMSFYHIVYYVYLCLKFLRNKMYIDKAPPAA